MSDRATAGDRHPAPGGVTLGTSGVSTVDGSVPGSGSEQFARQTEANGTFAPPPARNSSQVGAGVFSNSGELTLLASDLELPGRGGVRPTFERRYRSSVTEQVGDFGRGFTWTYGRRLVENDGEVVYNNGHGERYLFTRDESGTYTTDTLYVALDPGDQWILRRPGGRVEQFEPPAAGGRLLAIKDRNGNAVKFNYGGDRVTVYGPRGRQSTVNYDGGRIVEIEDYTGRTVEYDYDADDRLRTVTLPNGGTKEYEWTEQGRLGTVTAPGADEPYLENNYDDAGRVVKQRHGPGVVSIRYEQIDTNRGFPVYRTHVAQKGVAEPNLHLEHGDAGHVTRRVFDEPVETDRTDGEGTIRTIAKQDISASESDADVARIETVTEYNTYGEWVRREFPGGGTVERRYDVEASDPRDRGNLLKHRHLPDPDRPTDHGERVITAQYGPSQRRTSLTDARGNTTRFEYDDRGNLIEKLHPEVEVPDLRNPGETRTERHTEEWTYNEYGQPTVYENEEGNRTGYEYYPETGPYTVGETATAPEHGGPLARVTTERGIAVPTRVLGSEPSEATAGDYTEAYGYDDLERVTTFRDGEGNEASHEYDAHGNPVVTVDRAGVRTQRKFDRADNLLVEEKPLTRYVEGESEETVAERTDRLREFREYDLLNNVVAFGQVAVAGSEGDTETIARRETRIERDDNANVVRRIYPDDVADVYTYSRRGKRVETRAAAGTDSVSTHRFLFRRDGQERARIDAEGYRLTKEYDGFGRLLSVTNPEGVTKRRVYDKADNLRASYLFTPGDTAATTGLNGDTVADGGQVAMTAQFHSYDSRNRCSGARTASAGCEAVDPRVVQPTGPVDQPRASGCGGDPRSGDLPGVTPDDAPGGGPGDPSMYSGRESGFSGVEGETNVVFERSGTGAVRRSFNENGNGEVTTLTRDRADNVVAVRDGAGNTTAIRRNGNGAATGVLRQGRRADGDGEPVPDGGTLYETLAIDGRQGDQREDEDPPLLVHTNIVRDEKDRVTAAYRNDKFLGAVEYDAFDRVRQVEDIEGDKVRTLYDGLGRQAGTAGYEAEEERWLTNSLELDSMGRVTAATDPEGRTISFERDASGRVVRRTNPDGTTVTRTYDDNGQVTGLCDANGTDLNQTFDDTNRLRERTAESQTGVRTEQYGYDYKGRLTSASDETTRVEVVRGFDEHDYLTYETQTVGDRSLTVQYHRTTDGQVAELTYPDGSTVEYEYDDDGDLIRAAHGDGAEVARFDLDSSRIHDAIFGDGVVRASYEYDNRACSNGCLVGKRFENADGDVVGGFRVRKNNDGTVGAVEEPFYSREETTFGTAIERDSLKRPTGLTSGTDLDADDGGFDTRLDYSFDDSGRMEEKTVEGPGGDLADQEASFDENGNYLAFGGLSYELDANGNRVREDGSLEVPDLRSTWDLDATRDIEPVPLPEFPECYRPCDQKEYVYGYDNRLLGVRCFGEGGDPLRVVHFILGPLNRIVGEVVTCCADDEPDRFHRYVHAEDQLLYEEIYEGEFDPFPDQDAGPCDIALGDESRGVPQPPQSLPDEPVEIKLNVYAGRLVETDVERDDERERLFVTHDAAGRNATVVDNDGDVREAVRFDAQGKVYGTVVEGKTVETVEEFAPGLGILNTTDAAGRDLFDRATSERLSGGEILDQVVGGKKNGGGLGGSGSDGKPGRSGGKGGGSRCGGGIPGDSRVMTESGSGGETGGGGSMPERGGNSPGGAGGGGTSGSGGSSGINSLWSMGAALLLGIAGMAAPEPVSSYFGTAGVSYSLGAISREAWEQAGGPQIDFGSGSPESGGVGGEPGSTGGGGSGGSGSGSGGGSGSSGGGGGGGSCTSSEPSGNAMASDGESSGSEGGSDGSEGGSDGSEGGSDSGGDGGGDDSDDSDGSDDDGDGEGSSGGKDGGGSCSGGAAATCRPPECGGNPNGGGDPLNGWFRGFGGNGTNDGFPNGPAVGFGLGGRCGSSYPAGRGRGTGGARGSGRGASGGGCGGGGRGSRGVGNCGFGRGGPDERFGGPTTDPGGSFPGSNSGGGCGSGGSNGLGAAFGDQSCKLIMPKRGSTCGGGAGGASGSDTAGGGVSCGCVSQSASTKMMPQHGLGGSGGTIETCSGGGGGTGTGGGSGGAACGGGSGGVGGVDPRMI